MPLSASAAPVAFPLRLSSDLRYLVDNAGTPVLIHGDSPGSIINFNAGGQWKSYLNSIGAQDMTRVLAAFQNRPWQTLVPDFGHGVVTAGFGTFDNYDYVTAARSQDGKLVMAYVPSTGTGSRTLTVDMTELAGSASGRWYNPTDGQYTTIAGSPFANTRSRTFTTPGNNGTGTNDWLLVLEVGVPPR